MKKAVPLAAAIAMIPEGPVLMVGGLMGVGCPPRLIDELIRQRRHRSKTGSKIVPRCRLPPTSVRRVDLVVPELAVIRPTGKGLVLEETAPGVSVHEVIEATEASLIFAPGLVA